MYRKVRKSPATTTSVVTQQPADPEKTNNPDQNKDPKPQTPGSTSTPSANTPAPQTSGTVTAPANPATNTGGSAAPGSAGYHGG